MAKSGAPAPETGRGSGDHRRTRQSRRYRRRAGRERLADVAPAVGERLRHTYDFGTTEKVVAAEPGQTYPRCVTGRRAGPPEDCGGVFGYADLLEILADPDHEEHAERLEWLGLDSAAGLDPAHFDAEAVDAALSELPAVTGRS